MAVLVVAPVAVVAAVPLAVDGKSSRRSSEETTTSTLMKLSSLFTSQLFYLPNCSTLKICVIYPGTKDKMVKTVLKSEKKKRRKLKFAVKHIYFTNLEFDRFTRWFVG